MTAPSTFFSGTSDLSAQKARADSAAMSLARVLSGDFDAEVNLGMAVHSVISSVRALEDAARDARLTDDDRHTVFEAMSRLDAIFNGSR